MNRANILRDRVFSVFNDDYYKVYINLLVIQRVLKNLSDQLRGCSEA